MPSGPARDIIAQLRARGVTLRAEDGALVVNAPRGLLTPDLQRLIGERKPDLLSALAADAAAPSPEIPVVPRDRPLLLGLAQQRMWLLDRLAPDSTINHLPGAWRLTGSLDRAAFTRAFQEVVRRHEILRTRIDGGPGTPLQIAEPVLHVDLPLIDLAGVPASERHTEMMRRIRETRDRPFDLAVAPLFRACLFRLAPDEHVFSLVTHHVIWDGWSWDILHAELDALYGAFAAGRPSPLPELPVQYADYALWHRSLMEGTELDRQLAFWRRQLADLPEPLELPADYPRPPVSSERGDRRLLTVDGPLIDALRALGRSEGATLFMVLLAACAAWLHRWSGQGDLTVGVPTQDRLRSPSDRLIGVLVNTLVIRTGLSPAMTFRQFVGQVRDRCIAAYDHQDVPFDRLADAIGGQRSRDRRVLYRTLFTYQDVRNRPDRIGNLAVSQVHVDTGVAPADVLLGCMVGSDRTVAIMDFSRDLFAPSTMDRMAGSFDALLRTVAGSADRPVADLPLLAEDGRHTRRDRVDLFAALPPEAPDSGEQDLPLATPGQEAMWFVDRTIPGTASNHLAEAFRIRGPLDVAALDGGLRLLADRHEALRYRFPERDGRPAIALRPPPAAVLEIEPVREPVLYATIEQHIRRPFASAAGPLLRAVLLRLSPQDHVLLLVAHNMVLDERSLDVLRAELRDVYGALAAGRPPALAPVPPPFSRYAADVHRRIRSGAIDDHLGWWSRQLANPPPPLAVEGDFPRPAVLSLAGGSLYRPVSGDLTGAVARFAAGGGISPGAVWLAALQILLHRYTQETDIAVGAPVPVIPEGPDWPRTVGLLQNTVVYRTPVSPDRSFSDLAARTDAVMREAWEGRHCPFARIVEQLRPSRTLNHNPLFQVLYSTDQDLAPQLPLDGLAVQPILLPRPAVHVDLALHVGRAGADRQLLRFDFCTDLYRQGTIERLADHLETLLRAALADPTVPAGRLPLLDPAGRARLLQRGRNAPGITEGRSVLEGIQAQAARSPGAVAVRGGGQTLTYSDLWRRSGQVAAAFRRRGVHRDSVVAVCCDRGPELVVGLLGVWRAGGAYLPLDPAVPEARLRLMLEDAACRITLTDGRVTLPSTGAAVLTVTEAERDGLENGCDPDRGPASDDLAYVIFTSGSTGRPKGVEITHGSLLNLVASMAHAPGMGPDDALLAVTTLSFDIAGLELWLPLWTGARVELADALEAQDGDAIAARLAASGVTVFQATPSTWRMLLDAGWAGRVRLGLCGGETMPRELAEALLEHADEVWNLYGPTETTIWSTAERVRRGVGPVGIGHPIANTRIYVLDRDEELVPEGVAGEIWIGGAGLARGYRNRPELTAERFRPDPFVPGGHMYRTGDLGRWRHDGRLEHLGRTDFQVKIRGFRIEVQEIELALETIEQVRQAVVVARGGAEDQRLVAYVTLRPGPAPTTTEIRQWLRRVLPPYMIPGLVVPLGDFPVTPNGKVDRKALPDPLADLAAPVREWEAPASELEAAIADIWKGLLGVERVGRHDNFFELGGHSLLSIRAVAAIEAELGRRVDPRTFFFQTLSQVAATASASR